MNQYQNQQTMEKCKFIGVVTEIIDSHNFIFRVNSENKCQLQQVVGLNIMDNTFVLASITNIDVSYFLKDKEEYFTSLSVDNELQDLSSRARRPKMATKMRAAYIGIYEYDEIKNKFLESKSSVDIYTPSVFQEVYSFDFDTIQIVYGLMQNTENHLKLGTFLYPNYSNNDTSPNANISTETFNSHTLISGVTGSGKSRLTAIIANKLASDGRHITIIDPHNEYMSLVKATRVNFFYKKKPLHKGKNGDINGDKLWLTYKYLNPQILCKLLPKLTDPQKNYIYEFFEKNESKLNLNLRSFFNLMIADFDSELKNKIDDTNSKIKSARDYAEMKRKEKREPDEQETTYFKEYFSYFSKEILSVKVDRLHVIDAVSRKILELFEEKVFQVWPDNKIPSWLDNNKNNCDCINIINLDYDSNEYYRRFIDTIIQCFFTPQENNEEDKNRILKGKEKYRTLIVDEAHLLLSEKTDETLNTSKLLSRLLRESRKFELSIVFITQNEEDVPADIKSQFQNRFKFREEKNAELKYLDNQTCMCSISKGKLSFPMRVDNVEELKPQLSFHH